MQASTATVLIHKLTQYGVAHIFGIPGVHTLELYRGLAAAPIQHITPRHEQSAGFMADGYARTCGKPGVCFIISGPGMTNTLTAMGQAYSESIPMLVISTVNSHGRMGSGDGWLHELPDQRSMVQGVCAFSHTVHDPAELEQVLARAFAVFNSQRPRPVHIEIPVNVLTIQRPFHADKNSDVLSVNPSCANMSDIKKAAKILSDATSPVLLIGGGSTKAYSHIISLAERLDAPVVMTVNARGVMPYQHALAVSASASLPAVRKLIANSDVVLGIGTEMGPTDYDFNEDGLFELSGYFIRIDIDAQQLVRNQIPQLGLSGDATATTKELLLALNPLLTSDPADTENTAGTGRAATTRAGVLANLSCDDQQYLELLEGLRNALPELIIIGDSTQVIYAGNSVFGTSAPASYFNSAMGFGTLGYALPAAIGAALANPQSPVVAISGDGGLQFCLAELSTAVDENLNVTLIVHENGGYHEIEKSMQSSNIDPIGVDLLVPDLCKIAEACGWQCVTPDSLHELIDVVARASRQNIPTFVLLLDRLFHSATD